MGDTEARAERDYLRAAEAAAYLNVSPKTVSRWAKEGKVPHIVTLGGHRRFPRNEIQRLARELSSGQRLEEPSSAEPNGEQPGVQEQ
jgi:excisionase family DNA binding protein